MSQKNILIVDDEEDMRHLTELYLENSGFKSFHAENGTEALAQIKEEEIDLVLLDIMMPNEDGFAVCKKIRQSSQIPVIFVSALGEEWDKVKALQLGGDDYLVKPYNPGELVARIQAVLRRSSGEKEETDLIKIGIIDVDKKARRVTVNDETIKLTLKEYELLLTLVSHVGQVLSREQLLELVWGIDYHGSLRTVDTHVKTLRLKLNEADYIQTVWGIGYKFEASE